MCTLPSSVHYSPGKVHGRALYCEFASRCFISVCLFFYGNPTPQKANQTTNQTKTLDTNMVSLSWLLPKKPPKHKALLKNMTRPYAELRRQAPWGSSSRSRPLSLWSCEAKQPMAVCQNPETPGEHQNRWQRDVPPPHGAIGYAISMATWGDPLIAKS